MPTNPSPKTLQDIVERHPSVSAYLYHNASGARPFPVVPPEFTNWRTEQRAWRETVALLDQSYHMTDLYLYGPDAVRLLEQLGINSFRRFAPGQAKQLVAVSPDGYVIGDAVLFYLAPETLQLVGRPSVHNWVQFHAETGRLDVTVERDEWSVQDPSRPRRMFRFQLQGPLAPALLEKLHGGPLPPVPFFHWDWIRIGPWRVRLLHHGMVGVAGGEIFGPFEWAESVREAIVTAGAEFGLQQVGSRAYGTNTLESGWISSPIPAVYTAPALEAYRRWLPATSYEATGSLGGSFFSPQIEDYYLTPWDLGYGHLLKFDHDFVGREALEAMREVRHRTKVTLVWNADDVVRAMASWLRRDGLPAKYLDWPVSRYAMWQYDQVLNRSGGKGIGFSTSNGFCWNDRAMLSLAMVDPEYADPGTEVVVLWGEPDGGSRKPSVEPHAMKEIRATVAPVPYAAPARAWRARRGRGMIPGEGT
ncbi:MAG: aminomethyl transferase family protein [Firmicutes bacterium]|nr:aminomethyl transferase family protein [Alicyclobacillaceae bacterium]MCL6496423.1 aminomethyl transferase family protein [Bacillota bacterium]